MMDDLIAEIDTYIHWLKQNNGLYLSLHPAPREDVIRSTRLIEHNLHTNPYCLYLKTCRPLWRKCVCKQSGVFKRCEEGEFFGMCYAGVQEFIYPFAYRGEVMGFISISGYCSDKESAHSRALKTAKDFGLDTQTVLGTFDGNMSSDVPGRQRMDNLIHPLRRMLELCYYYRLPGEARSMEDTAYFQALDYIYANHNRKLSVEEISGYLHCSPSFISHLFKRRNGRSLMQYVSFLRVSEAKSLLESTRLTIQEIAQSLGFANVYYFSSVFKKSCDCSPGAYRRKAGKRIKRENPLC